MVVNHQDNMGYDMALNSGFKKPMKLDEIVITFDADGQHDHHLIPKYINILSKVMIWYVAIDKKNKGLVRFYLVYTLSTFSELKIHYVV